MAVEYISRASCSCNQRGTTTFWLLGLNGAYQIRSFHSSNYYFHYRLQSLVEMCWWAATELETDQCEVLRTGYPAHRFQEREFWPCKDAKRISSFPDKFRDCGNLVGRDGRRDGSFDVGSTRAGRPCPVCETYKSAEAEYERAKAYALSVYNATIASAEDRRDQVQENSTIVEHWNRRRH